MLHRVQQNISRNAMLLTFTLPVMMYLFLFHYLPMFGVVLAFKDYRYDKGIFGSKWVGLTNFVSFFKTDAAWSITRNTILYNLLFIAIGTLVSVLLALLLNEIRQRTMIKFYQTTMFYPHFLSWVVVAFIGYAFFSSGYGLLNQWLGRIGLQSVDWYLEPKWWPFILVFAAIWKYTGFSTLINYAALLGIDQSYYEAAEIDGASKLQRAWHISIPFLKPVLIIQFLLSIGRIFNADFGLFYQVPMNSVLLNDTTQVIDTFIFHALIDRADIGIGAAVGLFQSSVGLVIVLVTNTIIRKLRPEDSLF